MSRARQDALLELLAKDGGWMTASALGDRLGVSTRSIRTYVAALNARVEGQDVVASGPGGYRARGEVLAAVRAEATVATPAGRQRRLARELLRSDEGVDVHDAAQRLFVSSASIEADLARVRRDLVAEGLALVRAGSRVALAGPEGARRRALIELLRNEADTALDPVALREVFGPGAPEALAQARRGLATALGAREMFVNEFAVSSAALSIGIAATRVMYGHLLEEGPADTEPNGVVAEIADVIGEISIEAFGVELVPHERAVLADIIISRGTVAPTDRMVTGFTRDPAVEIAVREAVEIASKQFGVEELEPESLARLALHVQNLQRRNISGEFSRNPLTRSLKARYPLLFDVAVTVAAHLQQELGIPAQDDEIAYLAMHIGGQWERTRARANRLTATLVCPGYYELHDLLRASVTQTLDSSLIVTDVRTEMEPVWESIDTDLVLSTIDPPAPAEHIVQIPPFLTEVDVERVLAAAARVRRAKRLAQLRSELERYFLPDAFVNNLSARETPESIIRILGDKLIAAGAIDEAYVQSAIERERMSSTAFTPILAVPHAMDLTAHRTAIALGLAEHTVHWGDERVQVVAMVAFADEDRDAFQMVFEQFVEVFSNQAHVNQIVRRSTDFSTFLHELAAVIDN